MRKMYYHQMAMSALGVLFLALFLGGILFMGGCGRKGDPIAPEGSLTHVQKILYGKDVK